MLDDVVKERENTIYPHIGTGVLLKNKIRNDVPRTLSAIC